MASIPLLGLGTLGITESTAITSAIAAGYRLLDCAPSYRNEDVVGRGIAAAHIPREELWVTSKLWPGYYRRPRDCLSKTLKALRVDYVDLYLLHWPFALQHAEFGSKVSQWELDFIPMHQVWREMESIHRDGLARHIGVANWTAAMLNDLLAYANVRPLVNQVELHPYNAQRDLLDFCRTQNVICQGYGPLGPIGHRKTSAHPPLLTSPTITSIASQLSQPPAKVLLAWGISRTPVVVKSANAARQRQNFQAMTLTLGEEHKKQIDAMDCGYRYYDYAMKKGIPSFA